MPNGSSVDPSLLSKERRFGSTPQKTHIEILQSRVLLPARMGDSAVHCLVGRDQYIGSKEGKVAAECNLIQPTTRLAVPQNKLKSGSYPELREGMW